MEGPALACEIRTWPLAWQVVEVGRTDPANGIDPQVDLTGLDDDISVSRRHACIVRSARGDWTVRDVGSANGTFVDEVEVPPQQERPVGDGSRLRFGDVALVFRVAVPWPEEVRPEWEDHTATERSGRAGFDPTGTVFGRRGPAPAEAEPTVVTKLPWYRRLLRRPSG